MAFKLTNPPYNMDSTPVYHVDMEDGVMGKANNNGTITWNVNANYQDEFGSAGDNDPLGMHESATKIDASATMIMANGIEISLFGRNITDEQVGTQSIDLPLVNGSHFMLWERGKEIGLSLKANF